MKGKREVIAEFNSLVNMTASELESWLKSDDSNSAGWPKDGGDEGGGEGESVGHDSGRKIVEILKANPDKKENKYTDDQVEHMRKVVSYCKRHLSQEKGANSQKSEEEVKKTKSYASLKNWGHDTLKAQDKSNGSSKSKSKGGNDNTDGADNAGDDGADNNGNTEEQEEDEEEEISDEDADEADDNDAKHAGSKRKTRSGQGGSSSSGQGGSSSSGQGGGGGSDNGANKKRETRKGQGTPAKKQSGDGDDDDGADDNADDDDDDDEQEQEENDDDKGAEKKKKGKSSSGSGGGSKNGPSKGETVSWDWGGGQPEGKVLDVKDEKATITTKRGNKVSRDGDPDDPAVVLDTGKSKAVKAAHELN